MQHPSITIDEYNAAKSIQHYVSTGERSSSALTNEQRAAIEMFEMFRDEPDSVRCYVQGEWLANWTGARIAKITRQFRPRGARMRANYEMIYATMPWGGEYHGRCGDAGTCVTMKRTKTRK